VIERERERKGGLFSAMEVRKGWKRKWREWDCIWHYVQVVHTLSGISVRGEETAEREREKEKEKVYDERERDGNAEENGDGGGVGGCQRVKREGMRARSPMVPPMGGV